MQKSHSKLGLLVMLSCVAMAFLVATPVSAHQTTQRHAPMRPHIRMQILRGFQHNRNGYVAREVIYGVGFNDCNSPSNGDCSNPCDSGCNSPSTNACSSYNYNANPCGNSSNAAPCYNYNSSCSPASSNACDCGNGTSNNTNPCVSHNSSCGTNNNAAPCSNYSSPCGTSSNTTPCVSHNSSCGTSSNTNPCANYNSSCGSNSNACDCSTVNVQSNAHIYGQNVNLSQVPVNPYGEFRVTFLVQVTPRVQRSTQHYTVWAINGYNNQRSNTITDTCTCE